jgi:hypothetical protein
MSKPKIFLALIVGSLLSFPAQAKLYKWVDDKGVTHYGETIPQEYANRDRSELNKSGRIVNTQDVLTPEERRAKEATDAKSKAELDVARNQKLHDNSLLNTYSNANEIDLARARNVQQIDARVQVAVKRLGDANKALADLQKTAETRTKAGKNIPPYLIEDLQAAKTLADKANSDVTNINAEKAALEARYDADKARYKELTGK